MAKTMAALLLDAADKARIAGRQVLRAEKALAKAVRVRDAAEAAYLELVVKTVPGSLRAAQGGEQQQAAA
ncbi:MAG: hypothetical protein WDO56_35070 [Gammaproteobacteria bacterium]